MDDRPPSDGCSAELSTRSQVVSNRMRKTINVAVQYVAWIPKYKVYQKRTRKHMVSRCPSRRKAALTGVAALRPR